MDFKSPLSFEEFKEAHYEAWKAQALKELKEDTLEKLQWKTKENIIAEPYYDSSTKTNLAAFHHRLNRSNDYSAEPRWWENRQVINYSEDMACNKLILEALEGGADGVILDCDTADIIFEKLLKNVQQEHCSISFITNSPALIKNYILYSQKTTAIGKLNGGVHWKSVEAMEDFVASYENESPNFRILGFNGALTDQFHNFFHLLKDKGSIKALAKNLIMSLDLDADYFQSMANVKAARICTYELLKSIDVEIEPEDIFIQANSTVFSNEKYGPHENMLKATTTAMAAIIGGCNALVVLPEKSDSPLQRRIARNVSNVLKEESHLGKILDPIAGSYYLEYLVEQTVKQYWKKFQESVK